MGKKREFQYELWISSQDIRDGPNILYAKNKKEAFKIAKRGLKKGETIVSLERQYGFTKTIY